MSLHVTDGPVFYCECCGRDPDQLREPLTVVFTNDGIEPIICRSCRRLIDAGLLRAEIVDGEVRYRQLRMEWTEGDLIPSARAARESAGLPV